MSAYNKVIDQLFAVSPFPGRRSGLETCKKLNQAIGNPVAGFAAIHVAGTNGKGSVSSKLAATLEAAGYRVGLFTSPHLICFRERIQINGEKVPEEFVVHRIPQYLEIADRLGISASFFDYTFLLAADYFAEQKVDFAVLEAGIGGRLDATNIVLPKLCVITSVAKDHTSILGDTIEQIAREKAGILKAGVPAVCGPTVPREVVQSVAKDVDAPVEYVNGLFQDYDDENRAVAQRALELLPETALRAEHLRLGMVAEAPCRCQKFTCAKTGGDVVLDTAHNPAAFAGLLGRLRRNYPGRQLRFLVGLNKEKNWVDCLKTLQAQGGPVHIVEIGGGRGAPLADILSYAVAQGLQVAGSSTDPKQGLAEAARESEKNRELLVVCGSFFLIEDALKELELA